MASLSTTSVVASASSRLWQQPSSNGKISVPSASLSMHTGSSRQTPFSLSSSASSQLLHCSFLSSPLSSASSFSVNLRCREVDQMFPVIDPKARPTTKPKIFFSFLWKQLNHLGNVGFDPTVIRIDPYGNVLYFHADSASPLA